MKIAHYINNLGSGGAEKLLSEILPLMKNKNHTVHLIYSNNKKNVAQYESVIRNNEIKIINLSTSFYNPAQIFKLIILMKKEQYDIIHAHIFPTQYWLAVASYFKPSKTKLIKTEHNVFNHRRRHKLISVPEKIIYSRYNKIISITEEVKSTLVNWLKTKQQIEVVHNGINLTPKSISDNEAQPKPDFIKNDNVNVLMVARFSGSAKDQISLINAINLLPRHFHVYYAGEGALITKAKELAQKLSIEDRVHFLGMRADAFNLMNNVDINVLSTNFEGFSGVTIEALASAKPFIGSDVPGVNNLVPDQSFLFPPKNPQKLAEKIKTVIEDKKLALCMVKAGNEHVKRYDIAFMADSYLKIYNDALANFKN